MTDVKSRNRDALKLLRERRGAQVEAAQARLKEQIRVENEIARLLKGGGVTVPSLAEATGLPTQTIFWHLTALKKYGKVVEGEQEGDYFQYRLSASSTVS